MYQVSSNPHIRDKATTASIMRDVIIALIPAALFGIWNFGGMAALNIIVAVAAAVGAEWLFQYFTKQKITVKDLSAVVTGLLLALNVPADLPAWMTAIGSIFAIVVAKTGVWRSWTELYESCTCRTCVSVFVVQSADDFIFL